MRFTASCNSSASASRPLASNFSAAFKISKTISLFRLCPFLL